MATVHCPAQPSTPNGFDKQLPWRELDTETTIYTCVVYVASDGQWDQVIWAINKTSRRTMALIEDLAWDQGWAVSLRLIGQIDINWDLFAKVGERPNGRPLPYQKLVPKIREDPLWTGLASPRPIIFLTH